MLLAAGAVLAPAARARAQVSAANILQAQNGNIPFTEPENRIAYYDRLDLDYRRDRLGLGLRFETYRNSETLYDYATVSRRFAEWNGPRLRARIGNFYTLLGRGLVHRSFELPGVILEQPGLRPLYTPSRDVDGVLIEAERGPVRGRIFSGSPSDGTVAPGLEDEGLPRHAGTLSGGEVRLRGLPALEAGTAYARFTSGGRRQQELGSGFVDLDPLELLGLPAVRLPLYAEYAQAGRTFGDWWSLDTGDRIPHALYAGGNLLWRSLALTAEWKDYRHFRFGTNDPPSLVREHAWLLLNRATHLLDAEDEQGFQLEATWSGSDWAGVTANWSRSDGNLGRRAVRFEERYLEFRVAPDYGARWEATAVYDAGKDGFAFVRNRDMAGLSSTVRTGEAVAVSAEAERQHTRRTDASFTDLHAALTVSWAGRGSVTLQWERTGDPAEEAPGDAGTPGVQARDFLGAALGARLSPRHELAVFAGERRGGRACTAGTCYEVVSFKGVEARLTSRF